MSGTPKIAILLTCWVDQSASSSSRGQAELDVFSSTPASFETSTCAESRAAPSITSCTSSSGAEAPAVMPTTSTPSQPGRVAARCRRRSGSSARPASTPISRRRLEFELFCAPTTRITSTSLASSRTAVWRFCVA